MEKSPNCLALSYMLMCLQVKKKTFPRNINARQHLFLGRPSRAVRLGGPVFVTLSSGVSGLRGLSNPRSPPALLILEKHGKPGCGGFFIIEIPNTQPPPDPELEHRRPEPTKSALPGASM